MADGRPGPMGFTETGPILSAHERHLRSLPSTSSSLALGSHGPAFEPRNHDKPALASSRSAGRLGTEPPRAGRPGARPRRVGGLSRLAVPPRKKGKGKENGGRLQLRVGAPFCQRALLGQPWLNKLQWPPARSRQFSEDAATQAAKYYSSSSPGWGEMPVSTARGLTSQPQITQYRH
jgi:hypothetical protein